MNFEYLLDVKHCISTQHKTSTRTIGHMSFLHFVACCLIVFDVSEGRFIQGIIGQNVSISWNLNSIVKDAIRIMHDKSIFLQVWPANNYFELREQSDNIMVAVDTTANGTLTLIVDLLNITRNNAGMYKVTKLWNAEELIDSVLLEVIETIYYSSTAQSMKKDTEEIIYYSTAATSKNEVTDEVNRYATSRMNQYADFPTKSHLMYIVFGMGTILAVAFLACLLRIISVCLRACGLSNINTWTESNTDDGDENLQGESPPLDYWTIADNIREDLSTGIDTILDQTREPLSIGQIIVPTNIESERSISSSNIKYNDESNGYLNPTHSHSVEFDMYIHPVHLHAVNTSTECTNRSTEF